MTITIEDLKLGRGAHGNINQGACLLEAASFVAGETFSDHPQCVSAVLAAYGRRLNDLLGDDDRQKLKPFIRQMLNTAGDGQDVARSRMASDWAIRIATPRWLDAAGLTKHADRLRALPPITDEASAMAARDAAWEARDEAWALRKRAHAQLQKKVKAELSKRGLKASVAAAVADAVADADADADAAAVAVADAVAAAAADAAAVAVAVAVADAVAVAAAAAVKPYWETYYDAVYEKLRVSVKDGMESKYAAVSRVTQGEAIALLGRMIDPAKAGA